MIRRTFLTLAATIMLSTPVSATDDDPETADRVQASAAQIQQLLSGNSIVGTWSGSPYSQYFDPSGFTVYVPDGQPPSRGKWRVKEETNEYDSWWENTGWTPYVVMITNDGYAWVHGETLEHFEVLGGNQVDF